MGGVHIVASMPSSAAPHDFLQVSDRGPVYSQELGLAIEQLPSGVTLADLWSVT